MPTTYALTEMLTEARLNMTLLPWDGRNDPSATWLAFDALKEAMPNYPELALNSRQAREVEYNLAAEWLKAN